ncbi:hypothetical protein HAV15_010614 [Penicillium sp. str. |nr:hypothetical protein HAV15_010614 [Penicillium sp. str. \
MLRKHPPKSAEARDAFIRCCTVIKGVPSLPKYVTAIDIHASCIFPEKSTIRHPEVFSTLVSIFSTINLDPSAKSKLLANTNPIELLHRQFATPSFASQLLSPIMAFIIERDELVDMVNCPACGFNNMTDSNVCAGTVQDGKGGYKTCGRPLPKVL